jgi:hypothetical protein
MKKTVWIFIIGLLYIPSLIASKHFDGIQNGEENERTGIFGFCQNTSDEIPPDGRYQYDIAFAEWQGKSMGEKVTVVIKGDSIQVIYEGEGQLTMVEPGEIIEEGLLRKHKSGQWIIIQSEHETEQDEIGGCTGGPSVIDFKNKKFWMC